MVPVSVVGVVVVSVSWTSVRCRCVVVSVSISVVRVAVSHVVVLVSWALLSFRVISFPFRPILCHLMLALSSQPSAHVCIA